MSVLRLTMTIINIRKVEKDVQDKRTNKGCATTNNLLTMYVAQEDAQQ